MMGSIHISHKNLTLYMPFGNPFQTNADLSTIIQI